MPNPLADVAASAAHPQLTIPDEASAPWNRAVISEPAAVVAVHSAGDVSDAVRYATDHGLRVAVRSSGHGAVPIDNSVLLIHTGAMTDFSIDPARRRVRMSAGARWQPVLDAAAPFGLAAICGSAPGIGAVGYLTGGGIGPLARTYGVSADLVRSFEVVVGDGRILRATPTENEDLYWGLRGGKATLGIVTSLDMDLVELDSFYGGALWFDIEDAPAVLRAWRRMCAVLPDQGTSSAAVMRLPSLDVLPAPIAGRQTLSIRFGWVGPDERAEDFLGMVRHAATPVLDGVHRRPYPEIGSVHSDPVAPSAVTERSALLHTIPDDAIDALLECTDPSVNRQNIVELRQLGGAIARGSRGPSAFCHRDAAYSLFVAGTADTQTLAVEAHAAQVLSALEPWTAPGLMPNFAASADPAVIRRCYDADALHWLEELGDHYDPNHVLHTGQVARHPLPPR